MIPKYGMIKFHKDYPNDWLIEPYNESALVRFFSFLPIIKKRLNTDGYKTAKFLSKTPENATALLGAMGRYPFNFERKVKRDITTVSKGFAEFYKMKEEFFSGKMPIKDIGLINGYKLMPHQVIGLQIAIYARSFVLGDSFGLGKTLVGIAMSLIVERQPAIIVVEAQLATQWQAEYKEFTGISPPILEGHKIYQPEKSPIYIVRYSVIASWEPWIRDLQPKTIVFDECHNLRNDVSIRYKSMLQISLMTGYRLGLTGTLVFKGEEDVPNIYQVIDPGLAFPNKSPETIHAIIRDQNRYIRRTRDEIDKELPPMKRMYKTVDREMEVVEDHMDLLLSLAKSAVDVSGKEALSNIGEFDQKLRQLTGLSKVKAVAGFVKLLLEQGRKIVLVAHHKEVHKRLNKELKEFSPLQYTGAQTTKQKDQVKADFIAGKSPVLQYALRSGSGVNGLQHVSYTMVFCELDWTPGQHDQIIGRLRRFGQKEEVEAYFMITEWGLDPVMVERLSHRKRTAHAIAATKNETLQQTEDGSNVIKNMARSLLLDMGIVPPEKIRESKINAVLAMNVPMRKTVSLAG